jgi:hypothetical protein
LIDIGVVEPDGRRPVGVAVELAVQALGLRLRGGLFAQPQRIELVGPGLV